MRVPYAEGTMKLRDGGVETGSTVSGGRMEWNARSPEGGMGASRRSFYSLFVPSATARDVFFLTARFFTFFSSLIAGFVSVRASSATR